MNRKQEVGDDGSKAKGTAARGCTWTCLAHPNGKEEEPVAPRPEKLHTEYQRRLELIHDPRFEAATTRFKVTPDDQYVIASEYQRRLELIHDPRFEAATTRFKVTPDDQYVIASVSASRQLVWSIDLE
ncbi:hypothetical protein ZWY2020_050763 [Hordeum vulgare]|nr:hypothetical protein ZWY2020_050763 [Hordeum vulgare]